MDPNREIGLLVTKPPHPVARYLPLASTVSATLCFVSLLTTPYVSAALGWAISAAAFVVVGLRTQYMLSTEVMLEASVMASTIERALWMTAQSATGYEDAIMEIESVSRVVTERLSRTEDARDYDALKTTQGVLGAVLERLREKQASAAQYTAATQKPHK